MLSENLDPLKYTLLEIDQNSYFQKAMKRPLGDTRCHYILNVFKSLLIFIKHNFTCCKEYIMTIT